ncbi:hypothetical protein [Paraburkholderia sartisoli]|nr:hypothetical protein [Paraburkholderia sartisoli]
MTAMISTAEPITMVTQLSFIIASFKQKRPAFHAGYRLRHRVPRPT